MFQTFVLEVFILRLLPFILFVFCFKAFWNEDFNYEIIFQWNSDSSVSFEMTPYNL